MKKSREHQFLGILFLLSILFIFTSLSIITFEYLKGNGDGIWFDVDIRHFAFKAITILYVVAIALYLLLFGPDALKGIIVSTFLFLLLVYSIEKASLWIVNAQSKPQAQNTPEYTPFIRTDWTDSFNNSDTLGVAAKKNWNIKWVPIKNDIVYDTVHISTDFLGRRTTVKPTSDSTNRYALFFGCSYTYGDGVSDHETLPSFVQSLAPTTQVYNYGYLAYSPLHMLAQLQQMDIRNDISHSKGIAFFTLINDHVDRVIPATRWIELTLGKFPYLDHSTMTTDGIFHKKRRIYTDFILDFQHRGIKQLLKWGYPKQHTPEHYQLVVDIIAKAKEEFKKQFDNEEFYVIIFPGNPISDEMKKQLEDKGISYKDYSSLIITEDKMLPFDNAHPSPLVYQTIAEQLHKDFSHL